MLSVIIPAYNEAKTIENCLFSLCRQTTRELFEVIVVDNNCTDATTAIAISFQDRLNLRVVREHRQTRGAARRRGFKEARGEILFSTDADTIVPPDWIERMLAAVVAPGCAAAAGPARIADCSWAVNQAYNIIQPFSARGYRWLFGHYWLPGFNFAIHRRAYFAAGEFDSVMNALEDNDLSWRVRRFGAIAFVGPAKVTYSGRRFRQRLWRGLAEHITAFAQYYFLKNKKIFWADIR